MTRHVARISCPYCGSLGSDVKRQQHYGQRVWIDCRLCQARGPVARDTAGANAAWNRRVASRESATIYKFTRLDNSNP